MATDHYVDGTFTIAVNGNITGTLTAGEILIQDTTYAVAIYATTVGGAVIVGYYQPGFRALTYVPSADDNHIWRGRKSTAYFTPSAIPLANGSDDNPGTLELPYQTLLKANTIMTGDQNGNTLYGICGSWWVDDPMRIMGYGNITNIFTIDSYDKYGCPTLKPTVSQSIDIPSGPLWSNNVTRGDAFSNIYSAVASTDDYAEVDFYEIGDGGPQIVYDLEYGDRAAGSLFAAYFNIPSGKPVTAVAVNAGGSGYYATNGTQTGTLYLCLSVQKTVSYNYSAVISVTITNGVVDTPQTPTIICPGVNYANGAAIATAIPSTLPGGISNYSLAGSGCTITVTVAADQVLTDYLAVVDYWPGTAYWSGDVIYMQPMYNWAPWPDDPLATVLSGSPDMTQPGNDYWLNINPTNCIGPGTTDLTYVDVQNWDGYFSGGVVASTDEVYGNKFMTHTNYYNIGGYYPKGDVFDLNGNTNTMNNMNAYFANGGNVFYACNWQTMTIPTTDCSFNDCTLHSTVEPWYKKRWSPVWGGDGTGRTAFRGFFNPVAVVDNSEGNTHGLSGIEFNNIIINDSVETCLNIFGGSASDISDVLLEGLTVTAPFTGILARTYRYTSNVIFSNIDNSAAPGIIRDLVTLGGANATLRKSKIFMSSGTYEAVNINAYGTTNSLFTVTDNVFYGATALLTTVDAITLYNMQDGTTLNISNNSVYKFKNGINVEGTYKDVSFIHKNNIYHSLNYYAIASTTPYTNLQSDYNCVYNFTNFTNIGGAKTLAQWKVASDPAQDQHSFVADPLWVDVATGDLRIPYTSPCMNTGVIVPGITSDLRGNVVPGGPYPDIGAYEHSSQAHADLKTMFGKLNG